MVVPGPVVSLVASCVLVMAVIGAAASPPDPVVHVEEDGSMHIISGGNIHLRPGVDEAGNGDGDSAVYLGSENHMQMLAQLRDAQAMLGVMQREQDNNLPACDGIAPYTLDCASGASRAAVARDRPCEVLGIVNCCCDEARNLRRANGDVHFSDTEAAAHANSTASNSDGQDMLYATLGHITHVAGSLVIERTANTHISLGRLEHVGKSIVLCNNPALTRIDMPALRNVAEGLGVRGNAVLNNVTAPVLTHVGTLLAVHNPAWLAVSLASLQYVHSDVLLEDNVMLTSVVAEDLRYVGEDFTIVDCANLSQLFLGRLAHVGGALRVRDTRLASLQLGALASLGGAISVASNEKLNTLNISSLEAVPGPLNATHNQLTLINMPRLMSVGGSLRLSNNSLSVFDYAVLTSIGGNLDLRMNNLRFFTIQPIANMDRVFLQGNNQLGQVECAATPITCIGLGPETSAGMLCPPLCS